MGEVQRDVTNHGCLVHYRYAQTEFAFGKFKIRPWRIRHRQI